MASLAEKDLASRNDDECAAKRYAKQVKARERYLAQKFAKANAALAAKQAEQEAKKAQQKAEQDVWRVEHCGELIQAILNTANQGLQLKSEDMEYGATIWSQLDWDISQVSFKMAEQFVSKIRSIDPTIDKDELPHTIREIFENLFEATFLDDIVRVLLDADSDSDTQAMIEKLRIIMDNSNWRELIRAEAMISLPSKFVHASFDKMQGKSPYSAQDRFELPDSIQEALRDLTGAQPLDLTHVARHNPYQADFDH